MNKYTIFFFFLLLTTSLSARKADDGEQFFNKNQFAKARTIYEGLLKQKPTDPLYNYRYARCCYELKDAETAIQHFQMCGNKYPLRDLYLGELYFNTYRFEESVMAYQTYMTTLKPDDAKLQEYQRKVKLAEMGVRMVSKVDDIVVVDSMVVNKSDFLKYYTFSNELGSLSQEQLKLSARRTVDKIKFTTQRKDRVIYSDTIDGHMNIFTSYKLLDSWSEPASISDSVNTAANENYPFVLLDGVTVYFASDGEKSIGGYDLFVTRYTPATNSYLPPENLGFPVNSPANDYMMVIDEQRKLGWFATDRRQPSGKVIIYTFIPNEAKIIVRSEDKEFVRNVAKLKTHRKAVAAVADSSVLVQNQLPELEKLIEFIVNDSMVYTHVKQFKSQEAIAGWSELHKLANELKKASEELVKFRSQYADVETTDKKTVLSKSILELEKHNRELEKLISIKIIEIRNAENKWLINGRKN